MKKDRNNFVRVLGTVFGLAFIIRDDEDDGKKKKSFESASTSRFVFSGRGRVPRSVWICIFFVVDERTVSVLSVGDHSRVLFT